METLGRRMSRLRKEKMLKRYDIAEPLGVDAETIARYERDEREPKVSDAAAIAAILGVSLEYLATGVVSPLESSAFKCAKDDKIIVPVLDVGDLGDCAPSQDNLSKCTEYIVVPREFVGDLQNSVPPFAITVHDDAFARFGIRGGCRVVVNPAERVADFDICYIFYRGKYALKRPRRAKDGAVYLASGAEEGALRVPPEDAADEAVFKIIGKAVAYQFSETKKIHHDI